jgi:hypothetical protein
LLLAARNPSANRSLIVFTAWSSFMEALFSELKNLIGLRRLRLRRIKFVREQFYQAAVAQNLKRLVRFLNMRAQPAMATA